MIKHKPLKKVLLIMLLSATLFWGFAKFLYETDNKYTDDSLQPISGILVLSQEDVQNDLFFLTHGWQYFDNAFLTPEDFEQGMPQTPMQFLTIGKYNNFSLGSNRQSPYGVATYRLILDLPITPQIYALELPEIYSSYNVYINEDLVLSMGTPENIEIGKNTICFSASGPTELLIATANNSHYYSGMTFPPAFGLHPVISHWRDTAFSLHMFLIVLIFMLCLFTLYFGIKLKNKSALLLSLLSFFVLMQSIYPVFFRFFSVKHHLIYAVELFSIYIIYLLIIQLQHGILNGSTIFYKPMSRVLFIFSCLSFLYGITSFDSPMIHYGFSILVLFIKYSIAIYLLVNTIYGAYLGENGASLAAVFTGVVPIALFSDRLFSFYEPIYGSFFSEYSGLIIVLLGASYIWINLTEAYRFKVTFAQEKRILTRQVAIQKSQYLQITEKIEETKRQRHDLRHHFKAIYLYLIENNTEKAIEYLGSQESSWKYDDTILLCENTIADALLQYYKKLCNQQNIELYISLSMPNDLPIEDIDTSIFLGNLLENAYHACLNMDNPSIKIIGHYSDDCFMLQIENTFSSEIRKKGDYLYSSKHEGFGIGTTSVQAVAEKYDGYTNFEHNDHIFTASITLQFSSDVMSEK